MAVLAPTATEIGEALWRMSPAGYIAKFEPTWSLPKHIRLMSKEIRNAVARAKATQTTERVIITLPPRHAKSETSSHYTPLWFLDLFPEDKVLFASYEATYASEWGWKVRESIIRHSADLRVRIDPSFGSRSAWYTTAGGGMFTAGIGGSFTGRGATGLFIIDDPFKNFADAHSDVKREAVWNWYLSTAFTRVEPGCVILIVMTRWHEDDLVGRVVKHGVQIGQPWRVLNIPAMAEKVGDPLGRPPGVVIWPKVRSQEFMQGIKDTVGAYLWAGMYQQTPAPAAGGILKRKWWRYYRDQPHRNLFDEIIQSWDMAFKGLDDSDFVVGQVWGRVGADKYLLDQVRQRLDFPATLEAVRNMTKRWPQAAAKYVEDKANGPAVIATLKKEIPGLIPVEPNGTKEGRAYAVSPDIEAGNVFIPHPDNETWVDEFLGECSAFPNGSNDDQVDACTQALLELGAAMQGGFGVDYRDDRLAGRR